MRLWGSENMIKFITNLMNLPNAGQPVCSQPKHTHQQHQYSCSIFNIVVQFASNPTQSEQPDHLQRAEQTTDALKPDRKAEVWVDMTQSVNSILVSTQFCFRKLTIWGLSMHLHTRLHVLTAFTWKMLMQSQIQTRISYSLCSLALYGRSPEILALLFEKPSQGECYVKGKNKRQKHRGVFPQVQMTKV